MNDKQVAVVADVFTAPSAGQVLEVGFGDVLPVFAIVIVNGKRQLARGGVYSYYEFHHPMSERMTDAGWRSMAKRPDVPGWTASFMVR